MNLTVQLFASLAEAAGQRSIALEGLPDPATVDDVSAAVFRRLPQLEELRESVIVAVNEEYVRGEFPVHREDNVALIPPVSGGEGRPPVSGGEQDADPHFLVTEQPLDVQALHDLVLCPQAGAVSLFVGVVRDNNLGRQVDYLEYEAYPPMAVKKMRQIAAEVAERWTVSDVAMQHRTGRLQIGEASVAIAVSSPHRKEGIEACHYAIDRLKQIVPVWKKEVWTDGESWIEGSLAPQDEAKPAPE
jgi:molybdopterin converting factor subunit 1